MFHPNPPEMVGFFISRQSTLDPLEGKLVLLREAIKLNSLKIREENPQGAKMGSLLIGGRKQTTHHILFYQKKPTFDL